MYLGNFCYKGYRVIYVFGWCLLNIFDVRWGGVGKYGE